MTIMVVMEEKSTVHLIMLEAKESVQRVIIPTFHM